MLVFTTSAPYLSETKTMPKEARHELCRAESTELRLPNRAAASPVLPGPQALRGQSIPPKVGPGREEPGFQER